MVMETKVKSYKSEVMDVADKGIVTIAISRLGNVDAGGDVTHKGAFIKTFKEGGNRIKHVIDHKLAQLSVVGLPVKMYEAAVDGKDYAVVESALNLEKEISRDLFSDYKFFKEHDKTLEHSFAYQTVKGKDRPVKGEDIFELKMFEYSTVAWAMNADTPLLSMKGMPSIEQLENYLRKYDLSNKRGAEIERIIKMVKALTEPETTQSEIKSLMTLDLSTRPLDYNKMLNLNQK